MKLTRLKALAPLILLAGCSGAEEDVNTRTVSAARRTWKAANLKDYDLEWASTGAAEGHYVVFVRGGRVMAVREVRPDGKSIEAKPAKMEPYGVDGLFDLMEAERGQLGGDAPFGLAGGTKASLGFEPDPQLGYPRRYRRDVEGGRGSVAIEVLRLDTHPDPTIPPIGA